MISRVRGALNQDDRGFTLIELLVVMIIIGILAAIAIPVFLSQRAKARDAATKADVSNVGKEVAAFYVDGTATLTATVSGTTLTILNGGTTVTTPKISSGSALIGSATSAITYLSGGTCTSATGWIVGLTNASGSQRTYYYSAQRGLSTAAPTACA